VDGTLLNSQQQLTPGVEAAVKRAAEAGVPVSCPAGRIGYKTLPIQQHSEISLKLFDLVLLSRFSARQYSRQQIWECCMLHSATRPDTFGC
jgi:polygalacturonase